ncbi:hypothetical protein N24_0247 [Corynebacterium suranareeae]|uniref:Uncharacterized protein n=1 Tax=Corynebacterium suranareeae TaxID=2506452 RepID=A0A160PLI2_9CORY|nr:hypothetical protein N24_0247 [Corynebacterium suranareeae]
MKVVEKVSFFKQKLKRRQRWGNSSLISCICIVAALVLLLLFGNDTQAGFIGKLIIPLGLGLIGAVAGISARNPLLTGLNLGFGFFLVPTYLIISGSIW